MFGRMQSSAYGSLRSSCQAISGAKEMSTVAVNEQHRCSEVPKLSFIREVFAVVMAKESNEVSHDDSPMVGSERCVHLRKTGSMLRIPETMLQRVGRRSGYEAIASFFRTCVNRGRCPRRVLGLFESRRGTARTLDRIDLRLHSGSARVSDGSATAC